MKPQLVSILVAMFLATTFARELCGGTNMPCQDDAFCCKGKTCQDGTCQKSSGGGGIPICEEPGLPCDNDDICCDDEICKDNTCAKKPSGGGGGGIPICEEPGLPCNNDDICCDDEICKDNTCAKKPSGGGGGGIPICEEPGLPCDNDDICCDDEICKDNTCAKKPSGGGGGGGGGRSICEMPGLPCENDDICCGDEVCQNNTCVNNIIIHIYRQSIVILPWRHQLTTGESTPIILAASSKKQQYFCVLVLACVVRSQVQSKVRCSQDFMEVDIVRSSPQAKIYLQQLENYPDEACKPVFHKGVATFRLSLAEQNMSRCGIVRVVNKMTGQKVYYHRIIVVEPGDEGKHTFTVKCIVTELDLQTKISGLDHGIVRRSVLPAGFQEDDTVDIQDEIKGNAPIPMLSVGVRQGGKLVTGELNVSPGTPLQMEIFLDTESAPVYGLLVTYMQVTDTRTAEETIIFNGCSVDPYLFENFNTVDGDFLTAKFRAFKFPESTYVQFRGTVNVCLDKCQGVECSNGQLGFGRKKRAISKSGDKNKVFEVTMSTFIKVDYDSQVPDATLSQFIRPGKNRTFERSVIGEQVQEQFVYKWTESSGSSYCFNLIQILLSCFFLSFF